MMTSAGLSTESAADRRPRRGVELLLSVLLLAAPLTLLLSLVLPAGAGSEQPVTAMVAANALYAGGQFDLAAQAYAQLEAQGLGGQALLYNHGLALIEAGRAEEAIEALQRASAQYPRDDDIRAALAEAERLEAAQLQAQSAGPVAAAVAPAGPEPAVPPRMLAERVRQSWLAADELAVLALLCWTGTAALLVTSMRAAGTGTRSLAAAGAVLFGLLMIAALLLMLA